MEWFSGLFTEWWAAGLLMLGLVVMLMALSIPVAFAFLIANVCGAMIFMGGPPPASNR